MRHAVNLTFRKHSASPISIVSGAFSVLTLRELEAATCFWLSWLLTLYLTSIASDKACLTECLLVVSVNLNECAPNQPL